MTPNSVTLLCACTAPASISPIAHAINFGTAFLFFGITCLLVYYNGRG
jgi:hypothetical protein